MTDEPLQLFNQTDYNNVTMTGKQLAGLCQAIMTLGYQKDYEAMDQFIANVDIDKQSTLSGVAVLRYTSSYRDFLPSWYKLRDLMMQRVEDPIVMRGLI